MKYVEQIAMGLLLGMGFALGTAVAAKVSGLIMIQNPPLMPGQGMMRG